LKRFSREEVLSWSPKEEILLMLTKFTTQVFCSKEGIFVNIYKVRYKYKKDHETNNWVPSAREFRDTWLMLFKLAGIELPKHTLPPIKTLPLLCNYEYTFPSLKATQKMNKTQVTTTDFFIFF